MEGKGKSKDDKKQQVHYTPLSVAESSIYWIIWIGIVAYMMISLHQASNEYKSDIYPEDLGEGWNIIGRKKDVSDYEWEFWLNFKVLLIVAYFLNYTWGQMMSIIFTNKYKCYYYLFSSLVFLTAVIGIKPLVFLLIQCLIMYLCALSSSVILVWLTSLLILASLHFESTRLWQFQYLTDNSETGDFTLFVSLMSILRCLSFCIDYCWREQRGKDQPVCRYSFLDLLSYNFYLPLFNNGPVMTYSTFYSQIHTPHQPFTRKQIISLVLDTIRAFFWYIFLEVYLHFMYSSALIRTSHAARQLSGWALSGVMYSQLHIFLTKYVVMYQLAGLFARLDGLSPPKTPRCVSTLYTFTDMWRSFDRGLNIWMKRYIYIPLGGSRRGFNRQCIASFLAFGYVWAWHGGTYETLWWFLPNWIGVVIEVIAVSLQTHPKIIQLQGYFSHRMWRRIHAIVCVVPCTSLALSNLVFLVGPLPVQYYIYRLFVQGFPVSLLTLIGSLYLSVQTNIDLVRCKGGPW